MNNFLITLANMSISASFMVVAVLLIRSISKNSPKWLICSLWGIVAIRLSIPISFESALCVLSGAYISSVGGNQSVASNAVTTPASVAVTGSNAVVTRTDILSLPDVLFLIWCIGVIAMIVYVAVSYFITSRKIIGSVKKTDKIYYSDNISSPFVFGFFKPRIYIPTDLSDKTERYAVCHEAAHIKRCDHITRPLAFVILSLHWFNPFVWLAYIFFCRDVEFACDAKATSNISTDQRKDYSLALIDCSSVRNRFTVSPIFFAEASVKTRVVTVLDYRKPKLGSVILTIALCTVAVFCFMSSPVSAADTAIPPIVDDQVSHAVPDETVHQTEPETITTDSIITTEPVVTTAPDITSPDVDYANVETGSYSNDYNNTEETESVEYAGDLDSLESENERIYRELLELLVPNEPYGNGSHPVSFEHEGRGYENSVIESPIIWDYGYDSYN